LPTQKQPVYRELTSPTSSHPKPPEPHAFVTLTVFNEHDADNEKQPSSIVNGNAPITQHNTHQAQRAYRSALENSRRFVPLQTASLREALPECNNNAQDLPRTRRKAKLIEKRVIQVSVGRNGMNIPWNGILASGMTFLE
jgi:hypothetical protein